MVVPLRYGAGVKGKVVEAVYYGSAIVTTSIGAEGIPEAERVMRIGDTPEEFARLVEELYENPEECRRLSMETQRYIRNTSAWRLPGASSRRTFAAARAAGGSGFAECRCGLRENKKGSYGMEPVIRKMTTQDLEWMGGGTALLFGAVVAPPSGGDAGRPAG